MTEQVNDIHYGPDANHRNFGIGRLLSDQEYADIAKSAKVDSLYASLAGVLQAAYDHAAHGKGHVRHGDDKTPFLEQPTMQIARMIGVGYPIGQLMKKAKESTGMVRRKEYDAAVAELLGVINYAAAAILLIQEMDAFREV